MDADLKRMLVTARASLQAGRFEGVEALCRPVLARHPNDLVALQCAGFAALQSGQPDHAVGFLRRAVDAKPGDAGLLTNLGVALKAAGDIDAAVAAYRNALERAPGAGETWFSLGNALKELKAEDESEAAYRRALATGNCRTGGASVYCNLGTLLHERGRYEAAIDAYRQAIRLSPENATYRFNLANSLRANLALDEAIDAYDDALRLQPDFAVAKCNQALALLLKGDFARGFSGYEARLDTAELARRGFDKPLWRGEPLEGRCLILHAEQGYGDAIQFLRYLPMLDARGGRVVVVVFAPLRRLVEHKIAHDGLGRTEVIDGTAPLPSFDFHLPFMSLPNAVGFDADAIPGPPPYLRADPAAVQHWTERFASEALASEALASDGCRRIGLVWAGNPTHDNDRNRSIKPAALWPLLDAAGARGRFFSLQLGAGAAGLADFPPGAVTDLAPFLHDFADTAAAISALDLVICVDTAVAHLAGALGKRVELLLPYNSDWRWLFDRPDSPWYPTMRLHRQASPGNWDGVVARLAAELGDTAGVLQPTPPPAR